MVFIDSPSWKRKTLAAPSSASLLISSLYLAQRVGDAGDAVGIMGSVEGEVERQVAGTQRGVAETEFDTLVGEVAHVGLVGAESYRGGDGDFGKIALRGVVVVVDVEVELVVEECSFGADVAVVGDLTFEVGVTERGDDGTEVAAIAGGEERVEAGSLALGEVLVAGGTDVEGAGPAFADGRCL